MNQLTDFIVLYDRLVQLLINRYGRSKDDVYMYFLIEDINQYYEDFLILYSIYNAIDKSRLTASYNYFTVENEALKVLQEIINYVKNPSYVLDYSIKREAIISATFADYVIATINKMKQLKIDSVPIIEDGKLKALLNEKTLIHYFANNTEQPLTETTTFADIAAFITLANTDSYAIIPYKTTNDELVRMNRKYFTKGRFITHYFITKDGTLATDVVGLTTPYRIATFVKAKYKRKK